MLAGRAGPAADPAAIAATTERAYRELALVLGPVIGEIGVGALTDRALRLAHRNHPWLLPRRERQLTDATISEIVDSLARQDPAMATHAAGAVLATFLGLLATFIGESLAGRLVRQAWPDIASSSHTEET